MWAIHFSPVDSLVPTMLLLIVLHIRDSMYYYVHLTFVMSKCKRSYESNMCKDATAASAILHIPGSYYFAWTIMASIIILMDFSVNIVHSYFRHHGPLLLIWFNLNPSMYK